MSMHKKLLASYLFISLNLSPAVCVVSDAHPGEKDAVWVNQVFQKGTTLYEHGDYIAAVREWKALDP